MYDDDLKHLGALAGFIALLSCGFVLFITYQNSEKLDTDKTPLTPYPVSPLRTTQMPKVIMND